jgi:hypothetical protein
MGNGSVKINQSESAINGRGRVSIPFVGIIRTGSTGHAFSQTKLSALFDALNRAPWIAPRIKRI